MCGRFAFYSPTEAVSRLFGVDQTDDRPPRYNIAPTQPAPVVRQLSDSSRELVSLRWGLVPFWAKDPAIGNRMINARAETVASKPAFRNAFRRRRCLVVADGFYEWQKQVGGKQPWYVSLRSQEPFAMAGLWESWRESEEAPQLETCTIVTTRPNTMMVELHNRMPAILLPAAADRWLDPASEADALNAVLEPLDPGLLEAIPVSRKVNNPVNEGPELILTTAG